MFDSALSNAARELLPRLNSGLDRFGFYLAGGSGLALQVGARLSEDLDFFTPESFDPAAVSRYLVTVGKYEETLVSPGTLYARLEDVKLSFMRYPIPLVYPEVTYAKVRVADWRDILAEKFKTLAQRGSRKDFYDIYAAIGVGNLSVGQAVEIMRRRFAGTGLNHYHILKSLTWFEDADAEPELKVLKPLAWETVKTFFTSHIAEFERELLKGE